MKVVAIIQARMGSTRLPGKILKKLAGETVLHHVAERVRAVRLVDLVVVATTERVRAVRLVDLVVVATTEHDQDAVVVQEAARCGVEVFRGSEDDVLERYYLAAQAFGADVVVRVTSDCPLIDASVIDAMLKQFLALQADGGTCDYLSNTIERTYPRGLDVEVFTFAALKSAFENASRAHEREHVTPYLLDPRNGFRLQSFRGPADASECRWTLDTPEDYTFLSAVFDYFAAGQKRFETADVLAFLDDRPEIQAINAHIEQKKLPASTE